MCELFVLNKRINRWIIGIGNFEFSYQEVIFSLKLYMYYSPHETLSFTLELLAWQLALQLVQQQLIENPFAI